MTRGVVHCVAASLILLSSLGGARSGRAAAPAALAASGWPALALVEVARGLEQPVHVSHAGDGSGRLFVVEQRGRILALLSSGARAIFLDIVERVSCCGERGLLSVAFPRQFAESRRFYVAYTDRRGDLVVARFRLRPATQIADTASEEKILVAEQPYANHNGGQIVFGPDGFLYLGLGDGGSAGDPENRAQDPTSWLGKLLRIDVESGGAPYAVPKDNPFAGRAGGVGGVGGIGGIGAIGARPEIWALGLRNPWRFAFDRQTGDLYIGDVGQNAWEEIDVQPAGSRGGENYGWRRMEGTHCYNPRICLSAGLLPPVAEYGHDLGCSVTGGVVARATGGSPSPLEGIYFYGDYCSGRIWGLRRKAAAAPPAWENALLLDTDLQITSFGEGEDGTVYVADYAGTIYRLR
jgi:glucose/arabinose dehydrogenase